LQVQCTDGLMLSLRTSSPANRDEDLDLEFLPTAAVPVRESGQGNKKD
jgi:hypothetical protein